MNSRKVVHQVVSKSLQEKQENSNILNKQFDHSQMELNANLDARLFNEFKRLSLWDF